MSIHVRIEGGRAELDEAEIRLFPLFASRAAIIEWSQVDFVSITPSVKKLKGSWVTFRDEELRRDELISKARMLVVDIVLRDRSQVASSGSWFTKLWLRTRIRPLYGADDKPEERRGYLSLDLRLRSLRVPLEVLLDYLSSKARFDLLCHFD